MSGVKRFDCGSGGAQFCQGCYTMERDDEYGDYVLYEDYAKLQSKAAAFDAILALARTGHGPSFTQNTVGCGLKAIGLGQTDEDAVAAVIALWKMCREGL